ncbi:hypothetical protein GTV15_17555, partial [Streptomyces sp. SID7803]|nr:hypothetical protein [Streptomyces sp. SID7803]
GSLTAPPECRTRPRRHQGLQQCPLLHRSGTALEPRRRCVRPGLGGLPRGRDAPARTRLRLRREGVPPLVQGGSSRGGRAEYGQLFLVRESGGRFSRVDIHFGTYSVGAGGYLDLPLTDFYEPVAQGLGYQGVNPTGTLLIMFAHALSDGYVSVKDVNDTVSLALTRTDVDFGRLGREIRRHSLEPQARVLADQLSRLYRDERITGGLARELRR